MALASSFRWMRITSFKVANINETSYSVPLISSAINQLQCEQVRYKSGFFRRRNTRPKPWWVQKKIKYFDDKITKENKDFVQELEQDTYNATSPLKQEPWPREAWNADARRTGLIARKIGIYPQWTRNGEKVLTTLLQVLDNHVIRHHSAEEYGKMESGKRYKGQYGALIVGANAGSPQDFTKAYCGIFNEAGVMPKKKLTRFIISDSAKIQPGTPLDAKHFRVGQYVDVTGVTIDHGFQGVVKRWGMKGAPATHGHTKSHNRIGSIGGGSGRAVILKGKHMPGHMGGERRIIHGLKILRINYKYNVLWVKGPAVPGHVHHYVKIKDSMMAKHRSKRTEVSLPFPTHFPEDGELEEETYSDDLFPMDDPTITYEEETEATKAK